MILYRAAACGCRLGEGPVWSAGEGALYWLDILGRRLLRRAPTDNETHQWHLPVRVSALAVRPAGPLLMACEDGRADFDVGGGGLGPRRPLEPDLPDNRSNDGGCDRRGRFFVGTMDDRERADTGALYQVGPDGATRQLLSGVGISNTLAWSPDDRTFYFADSRAQVIWAFDYDIEAGAISRRRVFVSLAGTSLYPDGSTVDAEGYLWNCQWDGWRVVRYAPDGAVDRVVELPVQRPTSCAFGGPGLRTLYVTSARVGLDDAAREAQPWAGDLLAFEPGVAGLQDPSFAG